jgi:hypothetical protein
MKQMIVLLLLFLSPSLLINAADRKRPRSEQTIVEAIVEKESPLKKRKLSALEKKLYQCTDCAAEYVYKKSFYKHIQDHANSEGEVFVKKRTMIPCECNLCGKKFSCNDYCARHMKLSCPNNLEKLKGYQCTFAGCGKWFNLASNLRTHENIHINKKPYQCSVDGCGLRFTQKATLDGHLLTHDFELKPYECELCGQHFVSERNRLRHRREYCPENPDRTGRKVTTASHNRKFS